MNSPTDTVAALHRTPLYDQHLVAGAKTTDFGGWDMPVHYGSQLDEHHAVRTDAGVFDVSHMCVIDLRGTDARAFLRYLLANDVDKLVISGKAMYSCMLNGQAGIIDDLIAYYLGETWFRVIVNASTAEKDIAWIERVRIERGFDVDIVARRDLAVIAIQGPNARDKFWAALPAARGLSEALGGFFCALAGEVLVARTGYTGEDGFEVMLPADDAPMLWNALLDAGVKPCGLGARDTLRLEAGMNLYGNDMDESTTPRDAGLLWTVDLKSQRDFVGRMALERAPKRFEFFGLKALEKGVMRPHQRVVTHAGDGELTSGTFSPTLNTAIGLARLPLGTRLGDAVEVDIRGRPVAAQVVKLPFARNGQALV